MAQAGIIGGGRQRAWREAETPTAALVRSDSESALLAALVDGEVDTRTMRQALALGAVSIPALRSTNERRPSSRQRVTSHNAKPSANGRGLGRAGPHAPSSGARRPGRTSYGVGSGTAMPKMSEFPKPGAQSVLGAGLATGLPSMSD